MKFKHLTEVNQEYDNHFKDAMHYSWLSLKSSFFFFIHAIYPDAFKSNGSENIKKINTIIQDKMNNLH